ncbi:MAG: FeoB-associated Cys-rich membrane protein [Firmicutes bacterium]|nr:FeoB-associated Cys-rich membrane protein [Bacillota bacterium]
MINFLADNLATILISLVLIGIVALIIRKLAKDKKAGRSFCAMSASGTCGNCPHGREGCTACTFPKDIKIEKP